MATATPPVVSFEGVGKTFGASTALRDVTFSVSPGDIFGIIGESGAGKSTALQLINGLARADSGTVTVLGENVGALHGRALRAFRRDVGVVFQGIDLLSNRTVRRNVALPFDLHRGRADRAPRAQERAAVEEALAFVGLSERGDRFPAQLSGGERQRVGLARALVTRPSLLLCDEPTSSLDTSTTAGVLRLLADARDRYGTTIVVVTHDLDVVKAICDRVILLQRGELVDRFTIRKSTYGTLPDYREQVRRELGE